VLIRAASFDVLRCVAFAVAVLGVVLAVARWLRHRPGMRAALPVARIGERRFAPFVARVAPVAIAVAGLASLAAANRFAHHALVLTDRGGTVHAEPLVLLGGVPDPEFTDEDVWIINRASRDVECRSQARDYSRIGVGNRIVIERGRSVAVPFMPRYVGPEHEPIALGAGELWLTWAR
jgi:hypothetical protein